MTAPLPDGRLYRSAASLDHRHGDHRSRVLMRRLIGVRRRMVDRHVVRRPGVVAGRVDVPAVRVVRGWHDHHPMRIPVRVDRRGVHDTSGQNQCREQNREQLSHVTSCERPLFRTRKRPVCQRASPNYAAACTAFATAGATSLLNGSGTICSAVG